MPSPTCPVCHSSDVVVTWATSLYRDTDGTYWMGGVDGARADRAECVACGNFLATPDTTEGVAYLNDVSEVPERLTDAVRVN